MALEIHSYKDHPYRLKSKMHIAVLKLVTRFHLGPRTLKTCIEICKLGLMIHMSKIPFGRGLTYVACHVDNDMEFFIFLPNFLYFHPLPLRSPLAAAPPLPSRAACPLPTHSHTLSLCRSGHLSPPRRTPRRRATVSAVSSSVWQRMTSSELSPLVNDQIW